MKRFLTPLIIALIVLPAADAMAAHVIPSKGGRTVEFEVAVRAPVADTAAAHVLAGSTATTFLARVPAPHRPGCGAPAMVSADETGRDIAAGQSIHFFIPAPVAGWCRGTYTVQLRRETTTTLSPDSCGVAAACAKPPPAPTKLFAKATFVVR